MHTPYRLTPAEEALEIALRALEMVNEDHYFNKDILKMTTVKAVQAAIEKMKPKPHNHSGGGRE